MTPVVVYLLPEEGAEIAHRLECADEPECSWPNCACPPVKRVAVQLKRAYNERVMEGQKKEKR